MSVDTLLAGLGFEMSATRALVNSMGKAQEKNLRLSQRYKKQLSEKFRSERQGPQALLTTSPVDSEFPALARSALALFAGRLESIRSELERALEAGELTKSISELAGSYVHMHLNRLLRRAANAQEMVLYDFLGRAYDSRIARNR